MVLTVAPGWLQAQQPPAISPDVYGQLKYRYIGPEGNRATSVAGCRGSRTSGMWARLRVESSRARMAEFIGGAIFDSEAVASIGSLAVAASDPNIVWAGNWGIVYSQSQFRWGRDLQSLDAGKTWSLMGLEKTGRIGRVEIDPRNPDVVLACALGHAYGPQPERGVFRTTDGGKTWDKALFVDENTGCSDMGMDPTSANTFCGMWQIEIHTWGARAADRGAACSSRRMVA